MVDTIDSMVITVRTLTGIFTVDVHDGRIVCSCGEPERCSHVGHALASLQDIVR